MTSVIAQDLLKMFLGHAVQIKCRQMLQVTVQRYEIIFVYTEIVDTGTSEIGQLRMQMARTI